MKKLYPILFILFFSINGFSQSAANDCSTSGPAFTIEGFNSNQMTGGCQSGRVHRIVNSLADENDGEVIVDITLREAINVSTAGAPLLISFGIAGYIDLLSQLTIDRSDVTIDGIDAPGHGIMIRGAQITLGADTNNVILRFIRTGIGVQGGNDDSIQLNGATNILITQCSIRFAEDENINISGETPNHSSDVIIQYSIIAYGLDSRFGMIVNSNATRVSLHHNLFVHHEDRHPNMSSNGLIEVINNVFYNTGFCTTLTNQQAGVTLSRMDYIKNKGIRNASGVQNMVTSGDSAVNDAEIFATGNVWSGTNILNPNPSCPPGVACWEVFSRINPSPNITEHSANDLVDPVSSDYLLNKVGAYQPCLDAIDIRAIRDVLEGTGAWIDTPNDIGGYPDLTQPCGREKAITRGVASGKVAATNRATAANRVIVSTSIVLFTFPIWFMIYRMIKQRIIYNQNRRKLQLKLPNPKDLYELNRRHNVSSLDVFLDRKRLDRSTSSAYTDRQ